MCALDNRSSPGRVRRARSAPRQRGISIIELMVGIVVAMLVGAAATSSAVVFTASQRQGIGVGGVAVNIGTALAALKNDAATSGLGFFGDSRFICSTLNLGIGATATWNGAPFVPVRISADAGEDVIDVVQSTRVESGANVLLQTESTGATAVLKSYLPVSNGDAVLLAPNAVGSPCTVRTVTGVVSPTGPDTWQTLSFDSSGTHNTATFSTAPTYPEMSGVTLLGQLRWNRYRLSAGNLVLEHPLDGASAILARNVVALRAQYGAAAAGTTSLASWEDPSGGFAALDASNIARVRAVRVGVVTRSPQREKPNAAGVCEASSAKPRLFGVEITPAETDWQCFRYRSAVVVIPLRNLVLGIKS